MNCYQFYNERDHRTRQYIGADLQGSTMPIGVFAGHDVINSPAGQVMLLSLANLLARVHRNISFVLPRTQAHLLIPYPFNYLTIHDSLLKLCESIDPFGRFRVVHQAPAELVVGTGRAHVVGGVDEKSAEGGRSEPRPRFGFPDFLEEKRRAGRRSHRHAGAAAVLVVIGGRGVEAVDRRGKDGCRW